MIEIAGHEVITSVLLKTGIFFVEYLRAFRRILFPPSSGSVKCDGRLKCYNHHRNTLQ